MAISKAKLASDILGLGSGGGELEKLTIFYKDGKGQTVIVDAPLFNPSELSLSRSVLWKQKGVAQQSGNWQWSDMQQDFRKVKAETLSIDLFFDSYESKASGNVLKQAAKSLVPPNPFQKRDASPVTDYTKQIAKLAKVDRELHHPPICHLQWGKFKIFRGVLTDLKQKFTLFLDDGTPVRAALTCTFAEFATKAHYKANELHSADVAKTRLVRRNDTLHSLATEEYGDPVTVFDDLIQVR